MNITFFCTCAISINICEEVSTFIWLLYGAYFVGTTFSMVSNILIRFLMWWFLSLIKYILSGTARYFLHFNWITKGFRFLLFYIKRSCCSGLDWFICNYGHVRILSLFFRSKSITVLIPRCKCLFRLIFGSRMIKYMWFIASQLLKFYFFSVLIVRLLF